MHSPNSLLLMTVLLLNAAAAIPLASSHHADQLRQSWNASCPGRNLKRFEPNMYTILPGQPNISSSKTDYLNVSGLASPNPGQEQVAIFNGLPSNAQNCSLQWAVGAERIFNVTGYGLVEATQLTGLPTGAITWSSIQPVLGAQVGSGDFTGWPQVNGTQMHIVGSATCGNVMAFRFRMGAKQSGAVTLKQSYEDGWYVNYDC